MGINFGVVAPPVSEQEASKRKIRCTLPGVLVKRLTMTKMIEIG
jgi:hypothetical protein